MTETQVAPLSTDEVRQLNVRFAGETPTALLRWALDRYGRRVALASSFGAEDVALIDMLWGVDPGARVFSLDTLRLHTETYDVIDAIRARYSGEIEILYPDLAEVDVLVREQGYNVTGLRAYQAATRTDTALIELDPAHPGMIKHNPLAGWTSDQVWDYIREHDVPYNALHDQGFPSIGCAPCTRAVAPGEDPRAGRWWWEQDAAAKECGIHVAYDASGKAILVRGHA
jgi:3'-phosphoadenosine 5'-phosphosulfate sulfotransferase (PAPS reductase)/FAD synthetase